MLEISFSSAVLTAENQPCDVNIQHAVYAQMVFDTAMHKPQLYNSQNQQEVQHPEHKSA